MPDPVFPRGLLRAIRDQYRLDWFGIHGVRHWARVLENGLRLARVTRARADVIKLFAVFHDACRHNDDHDPQHGPRGATLAARLRGRHFELDDAGFALLTRACRHHTDGRTDDSATVLTCWDADRLDLRRVGITPRPARLGTDAARDPDCIRWANSRATADDFPFSECFALSDRTDRLDEESR